MKETPKLVKNVIIITFLTVPFISSLISSIHITKLLSLGNAHIIAIILAVTYEIANLTILMAMVLMKKLRAFFVWACFVVLLSVQIVGNVYYSYDFILINISGNPGYLSTFVSFIQEMIEFESSKTIVFTLACFLGLPIPMVSLFLVKSVVDYLELGDEEVTTKEEPIEEPAKEEPIKEEPARSLIIVTEDRLVAENPPEVINTEEKHEPVHIGVTIKPQDDNNGEHRDQ